ncbi:MAG: LytTR family transcriptional regulator DNA-binding domain-containing protein [Paracoccaceae bacterium]
MLLVCASFAVVLMAGFTGLSLTQGASELDIPARKRVVSMSAIALGGGIWSIHFIAMLGLQLPIDFYYDALTTMISALVSILITGLALLMVHFGPRTQGRIFGAGLTVGIGIPIMHYLGMSGMELAEPSYTVAGVVIALIASIILSTIAFWIAYGERDARHILLGTLGFAVAVFTVHFIAMAGTSFEQVPDASDHGPWLSNEALAFAVTISAFVISGGFLLSSVTFAPGVAPQAQPAAAGVGAMNAPAPASPVAPAETAPGPAAASTAGPAVGQQEPPAAPAPVPARAQAQAQAQAKAQAQAAPTAAEKPASETPRIPFEKDGRMHFIGFEDVAAIRAEGHYTILYSRDQKLFCPWSITETENRLPDDFFIRTHRSYLVNRLHVSSFERRKDNGVCYFDDIDVLSKVPVSRARLVDVRAFLGL